MKIITVNLPENYLKVMDRMIGEKALYPSRSELIRVAVREFLIKELEAAKSFTLFNQTKAANNPTDENKYPLPVPKQESDMILKVPTGKEDEPWKTYRIVKK